MYVYAACINCTASKGECVKITHNGSANMKLFYCFKVNFDIHVILLVHDTFMGPSDFLRSP